MISSIGLSVSHLRGYAPALPTPFEQGDSLDLQAFERICNLQIEAGAAALVVGAMPGEASTLTHAEHVELLSAKVDVARERVLVIAGTGSNSTSTAIELTQNAEAAGADAALCVLQQTHPGGHPCAFLHDRPVHRLADHSQRCAVAPSPRNLRRSRPGAERRVEINPAV
jgi:dihydrodipicolinate synthase/N-acetylneuraminate lyase